MSEAEEYLKKNKFYALNAQISEQPVPKDLPAFVTQETALKAVSLARKEEMIRARGLMRAHIKTLETGLNNSFTGVDKMAGMRYKIKILRKLMNQYEKESTLLSDSDNGGKKNGKM